MNIYLQSVPHLCDQNLNFLLNEQDADLEMVDASPGTNGKTVCDFVFFHVLLIREFSYLSY